MATEQRDSTILHEHSRVVTVRYWLALVNFVVIFLGTLVTRHFVMIRGASDILVLHVNALCVINAVQIILCLADYILRFFCGIYSKAIVSFSYIAGILWVACTCSELVIGSMELGALRFDLLWLSVFQFLAALIAYFLWPALDYFSIRRMTRASIRDNIKKRARSSWMHVGLYIFIAVAMFVIQLGTFVGYYLPPRLYELFSDTRALEYHLNSEGDGYYVAGLYRGTSSYVCVPDTYNNKPVVGIKTGALSDQRFLSQHKVSKIDLGDPVKNENGQIEYKSSLLVIESGAINNDRITELLIPRSVISISDGAFQSKTLKKVLYEARADFSIGYFDCAALETVTLLGDDVGNIVSLEGLASSVIIEVSKDNYNQYRKNNIQFGHSLRPILSETEFYVDIYTGCDYYVESIFGKLGEPIRLGPTDLVNAQMGSLISPVVDTKAYLENPHELGTNGAKEASAFRGWYYDAAFGNEVEFQEGETVSFNKTSAIYAKWIDEYVGELNWGTYAALDVERMYWTDEDKVSFPVIEDRLGYSGGIQWYLGDTETQIKDSTGISENVVLNGVWILDKPTLDIDPVAAGEWLSMSPDKNAVEFIFDENRILDLNAVYSHVLDEHYHGGNTVTYSLVWTKTEDEAYSATNTSIHLQNVPESGQYVLNLEAHSPYGEVSTETTDIKVSIAKKELDIGSFALVKGEHFYDSLQQTIGNSGAFVHNNIKVTYTYYDDQGEEVGGNNGVTDAGKYTVRVIFEKDNAAEAANYTTRELQSDFIIKPRELTFSSWSNGDLTYNSTSQSVHLSVGGILAGDDVKINYNNNSFTNAGNYIAEAISVSDPNYTLAAIVEHCRFEWSISPKEITIREWKLDGASTVSYSIPYNGNAHTITAIPNGVFMGDTVNFTYATGSDAITAINADTYTARINGVDNPNYTFNIGSAAAEQTWTITKKPITATFTAPETLIYNGTQQGVTAILSGIVSSDVARFSNESFVYDGMTDILKVTATPGSAGSGQLQLLFTAKNADSYTASVSGINASAGLLYQNYSFSGVEKEFAISPKTLTFVNDKHYTYSGLEQTMSFSVVGIIPDDLPQVRAEQFSVKDGKLPIAEGAVSGNYYILKVKGTDAKAYGIGLDAFDNSNYTMSAYESEIVIQKKPLTVTWMIKDNKTGATTAMSAGGAYTYNYNGYEVIANVNGLVNGETVTLTMTENQQKNAKGYTTKAALPASFSNYSMSEQSIEWTIKPYALNINWLFNGEAGAGAVPSFTYSASPVRVTPSYTLLGDDQVSLTFGKTENDCTNVGNYQVTITDLGNANYTLGTGSSLSWKILPKTVNVVWTPGSATSAVYTGQYQGPQFSVDGLVNGDGRFILTTVNAQQAAYKVESADASAVYSISAAKKSVNAGNYSILVTAIATFDEETGEYVTDPNYQIAATSFDFTITKRPLTMTGTWYYSNGVTSGVYTSSTKVVYNSKNITLTTGIQSGLVDHLGTSADVSLVYTGNVEKNHASTDYTAKVSSLSGAHAANYSLPTAGTTMSWNIAQKKVNFNWIQNSFVYNGNARMQSAEYVGNAANDTDGKVYSGDTVTMIYRNHSQTNAGTYTAEITGLSNSNYTIGENSTYQWSIAPKPIDLTWNVNTFVYNGSIQRPVAAYNAATDVAVSEYSVVNSRNVGEYTITALKLNNSNYVISGNATQEFTITPLAIQLGWRYSGTTTNVGNFTYDKVKRTVEAYATNLCVGDTVEFTYNPGVRDILNANTYTFTVTALSNPNYKLVSGSNAEKTVVISPRTVTVTWGTNTFTYDGREHSLIPTVTGVSSTDAVAFKLKAGQTALTNVGSVKVEIDSLEDPNYKLPTSNLSKTLTINPQPVTITWSGNTDVTFDGAPHTLKPTVVGTNDKKTVNFVYDGTYTRTNAGSQTITITALENSNYTLTGATGSKSQTLRINPKPVTVTWTGNTSVTFDGNPHSISATVTGVGGVSVGFSYGTTNNTQTNAGNYTVKIGELSDSNYTLTGASNVSCDLIIAPQKVRITWPAAQTFVYDGQVRRLTPTIVGADDGKPVTVSKYQNGNSLTDAGTLTVSIRELSDSNYTLSGAIGETDTVLTIQQQKVKITWSGVTSLVYDGQAHTLTANVVGQNDGKTVNVTYETSTSFTNAGDHTVRFRLANNNYTLTGASGSTSNTMKITPQTVSITWSGNTNVVYDGNSHTLTPTAKGTKDGKTVALNFTTAQSFTNAGVHTVTVALNNSNYVLEANAKTSMNLTIEPQPVVITWAGTGTYEYDAKTHTLTATVKGKSDGRTVDYLYTSEHEFVNAGTHRTEIKLNDSNYTLEGGTGSVGAGLTITKQAVTIIWSGDGTLTYDGNTHYLTAKVVGKTDGKNVPFNYNGSNGFVNVGSNTVSVMELSNSNYTLTGVSNTTSPVQTIVPQRVTVSWTGAKTQIYNGSGHTLAATVKGSLDGKTVNFTYSQTNRTFTNVGEYRISIKTLSDSNYTLTGVENVTSPALTITPQPVIITWSGGGTLTYDGQIHAISATVVGAQDGKNVTFTYNSDAHSFTDVGTYTLSIARLNNSNYTIAGVENVTSPALIIKPQPVVISWNIHDDIVYDGAAHELTATVKGAVDGRAITFTYKAGERRFTNVGSYSATVDAITNSNYTLDNAVGQKTATFSITIRTVDILWSGDTNVVYDGVGHSLEAEIADLTLGEDYTVTNAVYTEAGSYVYTVELLNTNCRFADGTRKITRTLTITTRTVEAVWSGETEVVFDGAEHRLTATIDGLTLGSDYTVTDAAYTEAGDYVYTVELLNASCRFADGTRKMTVTLRITPAAE